MRLAAMNVLFADGIVDCIGPFVGILFFLLISFGSWIMQQIAEVKRRTAQSQPRSKQTSQEATSQMQEFLQRASQQLSPGSAAPPPVLKHDQQGEAYAAEVQAPRQLKPGVATHVSTEGLVRHATQLGEVLDQADERLEQRLHQQFDHSVGALGDSSDAIHEDPTRGDLPKEAVTTREIIDVFRHPERVREAIIMAEILKRPV
jgi:hypothetical protein